MRQRTVEQAIHAKGVGLSTGVEVSLTVRPAPVDTGIVFRRVDLNPVVEIKAPPVLVGDRQLYKTLESDGVRVSGLTYLMSAFAFTAIDNAWVDLMAEEIPTMDGTTDPFLFLIEIAGIREQGDD